MRFIPVVKLHLKSKIELQPKNQLQIRISIKLSKGSLPFGHRDHFRDPELFELIKQNKQSNIVDN
jgi:hypothetical protein